MSISVLRKLVNNGWTIANRRAIISQIGKKSFNDIATLAKSTHKTDVFEYQKVCDSLSKESISKTVESLINQIQENTCLLESKTFSKLFSKEFQPLRKLTEEGYPVTTIIEKKTGKPIEVYFKKSPPATVGRLPNKNPWEEKIYIPQEEWTMYRRLPNGEEEKLGFINWTVQKDKNKFGFGFIGQEIEYLKHYAGTLPNDVESAYSGIGIRLNQLKIERFLQENLGQLEICSSGTAFPFHAKNGFKAVYEEKTIPISFSNFVQKLEKSSGLDTGTVKSILEKYLITQDENSITITSKLLDELCTLSYLKTGNRRFGDIRMELPKESLEFWKNLIRIQPIFG